MTKKEIRDVEDRLERREEIALKLADLLNAKIDECEELKSEITRLNNLINSIEVRS